MSVERHLLLFYLPNLKLKRMVKVRYKVDIEISRADINLVKNYLDKQIKIILKSYSTFTGESQKLLKSKIKKLE